MRSTDSGRSKILYKVWNVQLSSSIQTPLPSVVPIQDDIVSPTLSIITVQEAVSTLIILVYSKCRTVSDSIIGFMLRFIQLKVAEDMYII